jgi:hypothetical protein
VDSDDESDDGDPSDVSALFVLTVMELILAQNSNGLTKIDLELARLRGLLEKKYSNDHDAGYTYIDSVTSDSVPLTPFMMKEWARAMVRDLLPIKLFKTDMILYCSMMGQHPLAIPHPPRHLIL